LGIRCPMRALMPEAPKRRACSARLFVGSTPHWLHETPSIMLCKISVNELPRSKLRGIKPPLAYSHGPASLAGWMRVYLVDSLHANLSTTPTGRLGDAVAYSLFHGLAASHIGQGLLHSRDGLRY